MKYAIDYAPKEETVVIAWDIGEESKELKLATREDKMRFIEGLTEEDTLFMELGGGGDRFVIGARRKGASVFRIPSHEVRKFREERGMKKEATDLAIQTLSINRPNLFYPVQEIDENIAKLRIFARGYLLVQRKIRIAAELRLNSVYRDLYLIEETTGEVDEETYVKKRVAENLIFRGADQIEQEMLDEIKKLLPTIPVFEIFKKIPGCGPVIAGICIGEIGDIRRFQTEHKLVAYAAYDPTQRIRLSKEVREKLLEFMPDKKLKEIPDVILPSMIGEFPFEAQEIIETLGIKESMARVRRKGQTANWNNNLRHAVWLFTSQTVEKLSPDSPWKAKLLARKEREKQLHNDFSKIYIAKRARRWLGNKLLRHIWNEWQKYI